MQVFALTIATRKLIDILFAITIRHDCFLITYDIIMDQLR